VVVSYEPVAGTPYGLVYASVRPVTSGAAVGALAAGIASIVVALSMTCLGLLGSGPGWGALAAGAFAILAVVFGVAAVWVGTVTLRAIRRPTWWQVLGAVVPGAALPGGPASGMVPGGAGAGGAGAGGPGAGGAGAGGVVAGGAGMAAAGRVCGWVGFGLTGLGFAAVLLASAGV
jgi:hypothetical protein